MISQESKVNPMPSVAFSMQNFSFGVASRSTTRKSESKLKIYLHIFVHFKLSTHINSPLLSSLLLNMDTIAFISPKIDHSHFWKTLLFIICHTAENLTQTFSASRNIAYQCLLLQHELVFMDLQIGNRRANILCKNRQTKKTVECL